MKAALGTCTSVRVAPGGESGIYVTVRLPTESYSVARLLFRNKRVLITLADSELTLSADGMKQGSYRTPLPPFEPILPDDEGE